MQRRLKANLVKLYEQYLRRRHRLPPSEVLINGKSYNGIYLLHVRKTGGTTLTRVFLEYLTEGDSAEADRIRLAVGQSRTHMMVVNGKIISGWSLPAAIQGGCFWYGWSHIPMHQLHIHERLFTITCFRDPAARLYSHFRMLRHYALNRVHIHPGMEREVPWLGQGRTFSEFVDNLPPSHLMNQVYMFSARLDPEEAAANAARVGRILQTETLNSDGLPELNRSISGVELNAEAWYRKTAGSLPSLTPTEWSMARERLDAEYRMMELISKERGEKKGRQQDIVS